MRQGSIPMLAHTTDLSATKHVMVNFFIILDRASKCPRIGLNGISGYVSHIFPVGISFGSGGLKNVDGAPQWGRYP